MLWRDWLEIVNRKEAGMNHAVEQDRANNRIEELEAETLAHLTRSGLFALKMMQKPAERSWLKI